MNEGAGTNGVLLVGEALGRNEALDGLPFRPYAESGALLERAFRQTGVTRDQFGLYNTIACFQSARTAVYTRQGWKEIGKIQPTDLVLTHKGRFRRVLHTIKKPGKWPFVKVSWKTTLTNKLMHSIVTTDHQFMTASGWTTPDSIKTLLVPVEKCIICGGTVNRSWKHTFVSLPYCSARCHNKDAAVKGRDAISKSMSAQYLNGTRDASTIAKAANKAVQAMLDAGWRPRRDHEVIAKQRIAASTTRQLIGLAKGPWIGFGEHEAFSLLVAAGYDPIPQFALGGYNYDFRIGNTLIELDGPGAKLNGSRKSVDEKKSLIAAAAGFNVIHVDASHPDELLSALQNDDHEYHFEEAQIVSVESVGDREACYTLTVEEDHSYLAQGSLSKNCRPPDNRLLGEPYEIGAINHCAQHLKMVYDAYRQPPVIVALGAIAARTLTGLSGDRLSLEMIRGFPLAPADKLRYPNSVVIPTYHPAFLARGNHSLLLVIQRDLNFARAIARQMLAGRPMAAHDTSNYKLHCGLRDLKWLYQYLLDHHQVWLSFDFESVPEGDKFDEIFNYKQRITQVNFAIAKGYTLVADYDETTAPIIRDILSCTPNPKYGHNIYHFDIPLARWNGFEIKGERLDDTMFAFHHIYPDLPGSKGGSSTKRGASQDDDGAFASLQFCASMHGFPLPWKHLFKLDPHLYGSYDADANGYVLEGSFRDLQQMGAFESYDRYVRQLRQELDDMERRGLPCNTQGLRDLSTHLQEQIKKQTTAIQVMVPMDCRSLTPKAGYLKAPAALLKGLAAKAASESKQFPELTPLADLVAALPHRNVEPELQQWITSNALSIPDSKDPSGERIISYKIDNFELYNQPCDCLTKYLVDEPQQGCKLCSDLEGLGKPTGFTRGAAKAAKCQCFAPKSDCTKCLGSGEWIKPLKKCQHIEITQFWVAGKGLKTCCAICGKPAVACKRCAYKIDDCAFCNGSGKVKVYTLKACKCRERQKPRETCQDCRGTGLFTGAKRRWAKIAEFNFNSSKQVMRYAQMKGHKIPLNSKRKMAMDKETVQKLAKSTGDPVYEAGVTLREFSKIKGAYADSFVIRAVPGGVFASLGLDGPYTKSLHQAIKDAGLCTVHTEFSYKPATGQLSSRNPSIQVTPSQSKYGELATKFRENIEAPPGYVLLEGDYKSYHVVTFAHEAQDPDYIRLSRLDPHSFLAANLLNLPGCKSALAMPDQELAAYLAYVKENYKKVRNKQAKPAVLGYNLGLGAVRLYENNIESFANVEEAKWVIDMFNSVFPLSAKYRKETPELAHRQGYLKSPFGCIRWFMNVKQFEPETNTWKHGKDWEKAIAFKTQNNAHCILKEVMLRLRDSGAAEKYGMCNNIHDALLFCFRKELLEEAAWTIRSEMQKPNYTVLDPSGNPFWCEAELSYGTTWANMKELKLAPEGAMVREVIAPTAEVLSA